MSDSVRPHGRQHTRLPHPWDSPGKNTGVGCHFLLQCMKVESESEVAQSCPTLSDPMDCSPPGSSIHGVFQATVLEWGAIAFSSWISETSKTRTWTPSLHLSLFCSISLLSFFSLQTGLPGKTDSSRNNHGYNFALHYFPPWHPYLWLGGVLIGVSSSYEESGEGATWRRQQVFSAVFIN